MNKLTKLFVGLGTAAAVIGGTAAVAAPADAATVQSFTATIEGHGPITTPTNATLKLYDNVVSQGRTSSIEYYQHDGYSKTENLPTKPVLKEEDIENACKSATNDGSVNPVGGFNINCIGNLVSTSTNFPLGGDLLGRGTRVHSTVTHVNENATGNGAFLQVGSKDHGGMTHITWNDTFKGVSYAVQVKIPTVAAVDYNGVHRTIQPLVVKVVILSTTGAPHAELNFN